MSTAPCGVWLSVGAIGITARAPLRTMLAIMLASLHVGVCTSGEGAGVSRAGCACGNERGANEDRSRGLYPGAGLCVAFVYPSWGGANVECECTKVYVWLV